MAFVLGIDGGGSKTAAAVSDGISVFKTHSAKGCNLNFDAPEIVRRNLADAMRGALASAGISAADLSSVCAGAAGAASPAVASKLTEMLAGLAPRAGIHVVGDSVIALEAAFSGRPGVVCISGTGSVALGRNARGEITRAGGWGRMVSDEGSGHWIGERAVAMCLRALDQGRSSQLVTGIMKHWSIATREQLVQRCNRGPVPNFADLFPIVLTVADAGDPLATEILNAAAMELARMTQVVLRRIPVQHVAVTGSVFAHSPRVRHVFANIVRAFRPEVQVRLSEREPIAGALQLAWKLLPGEIEEIVAS